MLLNEILKLRKNSLLGQGSNLIIILSILISISLVSNFNDNSKYFILIRQVVMLSNLFIPILIAFMSMLILGTEYDSKMIYVLKYNSNNFAYIYIYKVLLSIMYIVFIYSLIFIVTFILSTLFTNGVDKDIIFNVKGKEIVFVKENLMLDVIILYVKQCLGSIFIVSLSYLILIITKNPTVSMVLVAPSILASSMVLPILLRQSEYVQIFSVNSEYVWRNYVYENEYVYIFYIVIAIFNFVIGYVRLKRS